MPASAPSPPAFGFPGVTTDRLLRATADVWVPCDEFAAASAALAYTMLTGAPARLIVMAGTGTDLAHPVLAQAAGEGIRLRVETGDDWAYPRFPAPRRLPNGEGLDAVTMVTSPGQSPSGDVITQGSCIPGAARFGDRWLGYVGYGCDPQVLERLRHRQVLDVHGEPVAPIAPPGLVAPPAPADVDSAVKELDAVLPREAAVVCDAGSAHEAVARVVARAGQRPVVQTTGLTVMGWSLGAALGVARAKPAEPVGVVIGDGSMLMRVGDITALARYRVPAVILLLVNGVMGQSRARWPVEQRHLAALPQVDWATVLNALGAAIARDVEAAVAQCQERPQVVLVPVGQP